MLVLSPDFRAAGRAALERWREGSDEVHTFEVEIAGEKRWVEAVAAPITIADDERGLLIFSRDVTDRRALEERLRTAQKEEGLSLMAAGIAHDFNNLLAVALVETELSQGENTNASVDARLARVEEALLRSRTLTQQLLVYSGAVVSSRERLDLTEQVERMHGLIRSSISREVEVHLDLAHGLPAVDADPSQLQQALMNLLWNASEATAGAAGRIFVRTGASVLEKEEVDALQPAQERRPGLHVWAEVRDNGHGIPAESLRRIFDPFYSSREPGRGLGLAAVVGIVRAHDGGIHVESEEGVGTLFRIYLPAADPSVAAPASEARPPGARVLLVHRDRSQRAAYLQALRSLGHDPVACDSKRAGLEALRREATKFDLIVSDAEPGDRGRPLGDAQELRSAAPDVPILMAGNAVKTEVAITGDETRVALLASPSSRIGLANAIDELLSGRRRS